MSLGKHSRSNSYDDIEYYHASKKCKYNDGSSCSMWPFRTIKLRQCSTSYTPNIPANTFRCDATTDGGSLLTATSVSVESYQ